MHAAIAAAEAILPGRKAPDGKPDARWKAMFAVKEFMEREPEAIWPFVLKWGRHRSADLRTAVALVILEHLLELHGDLLFPRVRAAAREHPRFADAVSTCSFFGDDPRARRRLARLQADIRRWRHAAS